MRRLEAIDAEVDRFGVVAIPDAIVDRLDQPEPRMVDDVADLARAKRFPRRPGP